ncbi:hypothetical protein AB0J86_08565 [Micromonospora sp. NPDC049559]|uniref:hypothetical protein n=1 Tax=Micromonospora sp. NPDC049559 TaxID=3155923 RepID=UPI00341C4C09
MTLRSVKTDYPAGCPYDAIGAPPATIGSAHPRPAWQAPVLPIIATLGRARTTAGCVVDLSGYRTGIRTDLRFAGGGRRRGSRATRPAPPPESRLGST